MTSPYFGAKLIEEVKSVYIALVALSERIHNANTATRIEGSADVVRATIEKLPKYADVHRRIGKQVMDAHDLLCGLEAITNQMGASLDALASARVTDGKQLEKSMTFSPTFEDAEVMTSGYQKIVTDEDLDGDIPATAEQRGLERWVKGETYFPTERVICDDNIYEQDLQKTAIVSKVHPSRSRNWTFAGKYGLDLAGKKEKPAIRDENLAGIARETWKEMWQNAWKDRENVSLRRKVKKLKQEAKDRENTMRLVAEQRDRLQTLVTIIEADPDGAVQMESAKRHITKGASSEEANTSVSKTEGAGSTPASPAITDEEKDEVCREAAIKLHKEFERNRKKKGIDSDDIDNLMTQREQAMQERDEAKAENQGMREHIKDLEEENQQLHRRVETARQEIPPPVKGEYIPAWIKPKSRRQIPHGSTRQFERIAYRLVEPLGDDISVNPKESPNWKRIGTVSEVSEFIPDVDLWKPDEVINEGDKRTCPIDEKIYVATVDHKTMTDGLSQRHGGIGGLAYSSGWMLDEPATEEVEDDEAEKYIKGKGPADRVPHQLQIYRALRARIEESHANPPEWRDYRYPKGYRVIREDNKVFERNDKSPGHPSHYPEGSALWTQVKTEDIDCDEDVPFWKTGETLEEGVKRRCPKDGHVYRTDTAVPLTSGDGKKGLATIPNWKLVEIK